ncbi:kinesin-like protein KIF20A isoform X1 [Electrophorus electricus]|uniref:kinesin-like protein KIF20A isoform X1 n=1 Tax=Electrophorus electricus TaxID=8005 RepID=UPI0015CFFB2B|nr:kinesin-like protein KIF20A isoform X1 [Electrophorus electricus]
MSAVVPSPGAVFSDEEECSAVFESTAADIGGSVPVPRFGAPLTELSVIIPSTEPKTPAKQRGQPKLGLNPVAGGDQAEKLQVFLRIRPLTAVETERGEDQGCVCVQTDDTLLLKAPKDSHSMKSAERGIVPSLHRFSFTKIFGPEAPQQEVYDQTMRGMVRDVLRGENRLLYTYGVTNSGKTYTIQGTVSEAGLLPRVLVSVFHKLTGRLYPAMDLKPVLSQEIRRLEAGEVRAEEIRREALLTEVEAVKPRGGVTADWDSGIAGLSTATYLEDSDTVCLEADGLSLSSGGDLEPGLQYSIWVSFYEIYNEFLYDLLETPPFLHNRKRATLRLSDDKYGNPYVKDLTWIQVRSAEEAWKVLRVGRRNQSFASTHLNHNSSRSHCIFTLRVLHIQPQTDLVLGTRISELSVCDLAGSERCKEQQSGERMKEATNINTSLLTLGRCVSALRHNQNNRSRPPQVVPFRDSKLTRVLQAYFCGHGHSCMMVNINPCASTYDETLQALKFSAIATQLVHGPSSKTRVAYILSLLREQSVHPNDTALIEEEEEEDSDEEGDLTMFNAEALLKAIDVLKREVLRQRQEKEDLEARVREEVCSEMMDIINSMQDNFSTTLESERDLMEKRCENKINNLRSSLRTYYSQQLEEREEQIRELTAALQEPRGGSGAPIFPPLVEGEGPRRSQRLASVQRRDTGHEKAELEQCRAELEQCRAELDLKQTELRLKTLELKRFQEQIPVDSTTGSLTATVDRKLMEGQKNLRQLRADLHTLGLKLQSGERACCRNTDGEKLRTALSTADHTLAKQDQMLMELHTSLQMVKAELRHKSEALAQMQLGQQRPPPAPATPTTPSSCKRRGCGVAMAYMENQPPEKRPFLHSLFSSTKTTTGQLRATPTATPYARVLRSRQPSPPASPILQLRGRY